MTADEKERIEYLKTRLSILHRNYQFATEQAIETALELIEKNQKEIEKYKNLYQKALDNTIKTDRDNIEKNKIIDEMAKAIYDYASLEVVINCPAEIDGRYNMDLCKMNAIDRNCLVCIKDYFKKKVEE